MRYSYELFNISYELKKTSKIIKICLNWVCNLTYAYLILTRHNLIFNDIDRSNCSINYKNN